MMQAPTSLHPEADQARRHARSSMPTYEAQLLDLLRIPSVSTQPQHADDCQQAAEWLAADMRRLGLEHVDVSATPGHPVVYGDWLNAGMGSPTLLIYGHYDVQPPDPLQEWTSPPFDPTIVTGPTGQRHVVARGASDDKGQLFVHLKAIEALLSSTGRLPCNVRVILEGEEESGSEHLEQWVQDNRDRLAADVCVISDTHMLGPETPSLITALRGIAYCEITCSGPTHDLHSGIYGGAVRNPAEALARIIAQLKDDDGRIRIPGFYDDVRELTDAERTELARIPFSEDSFRKESGVTATHGETGYSVYEQVSARPTLEVNGLGSGYTGPGAKTVLPAEAMAKVSMRLVPAQSWPDIGEKLSRYVASITPTGVATKVRLIHGGSPFEMTQDSPPMRAAAQAVTTVFGQPPVYCREGGSIPVVELIDRELDTPTIMVGFGLPDDRLHSPNEQFSLTQFERGIETSIVLYHELSRAEITG